MAGGDQETLRRSHSSNEYGNAVSSLNTIENIKKLVESRVEKRDLTLDEFLDTLRRWWCKYYKRPYKDPLLAEYSIEELAYEYFDVNYDPSEVNKDKKTEENDQADRDWAAEEDAKLAKQAELQPDTIEQTQSDEEWANKYLENPTPEEAVGDISTNFGVL